MQFTYPSFLWALLALAIPIIVHLYYFKRFKKVYFTNVKFLKEVKEETSARRKIRNFIVLLSRLLALGLLILAFAQPYIPRDKEVKKGRKAISVFIDNSFSMSALSEDVPLIEKAKQKAREIIKAYGVDDQFQILTMDFEGRHQRLMGQEEVLNLIDEVKIGPSVRAMNSIINRQQQALHSGKIQNHSSYIISDFQKSITNLESWQDTSLEINLVPLQSVAERNISIDSAWFQAPVPLLNQQNTLIIKVKNHSNETVQNIRLSLIQEGQEKPVGSLGIPPNGSVTDTVNFNIRQTGWQSAELRITDYPVQFDDKYFFSFYVNDQVKMLSIYDSQPNKYLSAAFNNVPYVTLDKVQSQRLNYSDFPDYNLIICDELKSISSGLASELKQYVSSGGNILVFPSATSAISSYKNFLVGFKANELEKFDKIEKTVSRINTEEFIFNDVFENRNASLKLPQTTGSYKLTNYSGRLEEKLLTYRDGSSFLGKYKYQQGHLYLCAAPLIEEYNNLVRNGEIFIPMLYKMAISSGEIKPIAYTIGKDELIAVKRATNKTESVYKLQGKSEEFIPGQTSLGAQIILNTNEQLKESGFYELYLNPDTVLSSFAFNYDRTESQLATTPLNELEALKNSAINIIKADGVKDLGQVVGERSRGIILWRWCLILALIFLAIEVLLLRFWKA